MAQKKKQKSEEKGKKKWGKEKEKKDKPEKEKIEEILVRIASKDIPVRKSVYSGLTLIRGISWGFSNAVCKKLGIDRKKKIEELSKEEVKKIEEFIKNADVPRFLKNRRNDLHSGEDKHLNSSDLDLQKEFDIKRLKKIRSYKGVRHDARLPVRGQRTRSNFRKNRRKSGAVGVSKKGAKRV